jgi:hypothetical protein
MNGFHGEKAHLLTQKDRKSSRGLGFMEAGEMLKSYRESNIWQKKLVGVALSGHPIKGARAYRRPRTLEPMNPRILEPSSDSLEKS